MPREEDVNKRCQSTSQERILYRKYKIYPYIKMNMQLKHLEKYHNGMQTKISIEINELEN